MVFPIKTRRFISAGEDEEWNSSGSGEGEPKKGDQVEEEREMVEGEGEGVREAAGGRSPSPGGLRVNPALATDPALRKANPNPETHAPAPTPHDLEYIASLPPALQTAIAAGRFFSLPPEASRTKDLQPPDPRPGSVPGYLCSPCGIRFSSLSTLEAHQTYYCSHRQSNVPRGGGDSESEDLKLVGDMTREEASGGEGSTGEPAVKAQRSGKLYKCPHCSYSADKKVSLNRHMRMHSVSPGSAPEPSDSPQGDRYCQDCDIRFSSLKTFRAHKMHYCGSRHGKGKSGSPSPSEPAGSPERPGEPPSPFLALPTNPILIVPYSLFQGASLLSAAATAGLPATDTACLVLPDGTIQPISQALDPRLRPPPEKIPRPPPVQTFHTSQFPKQPSEKQGKENENEGPRPLDLSCRRSEEREIVVDMSEDEKENRRNVQNHQTPFHSSPEHEDIICAPSIPLMLSTSSTCSSPSPAPASPALSSSSHSTKKSDPRRHRADSHSDSPSPKSTAVSPQGKSPRRTPNGIVSSKPVRPEERKKSVSEQSPKPVESNINLQNLLLAAVTGQTPMEGLPMKPDYPHLPFPPELIPHLSAAYNARLSAKAKPMQPMGTMGPLPMAMPQLGISRTPGAEMLNQAILPLLTPEMALRIAAAAGNELPPPPPAPQVLVKQGDSKCQECNIVFYKHENYIAHKKHYCSARKIQETSSQDEKLSSPGLTSPPRETSPKEPGSKSPVNSTINPAIPTTSKPTMYQFICVACGIKFTSFDNLTAHQTYYCPKRTAVDAEKPRRCPKCKMGAGPDHQCVGMAGVWKCPCCPVTSPTASAAQKHMDTHAGVKAFLCTICRYKGNTLRGMRTHIRMHFDKRPSEVNEESYITCIVDDTINNTVEASMVEEETSRSPSAEKCNGERVKVKEEDRSAENVKAEHDDEEEYIEVEHDVAVKTEPIKAEEPVEEQTEEDLSIEHADDLSINNNKRYCKSCDISFTYPSTFLAHKKYYCSSHIGENTANGSSNNRPPGTPVT